jgi:hypothetical protein
MSRAEYVQRALEMITNTAPFDISHHPAMSLPCGMVDGLPVRLIVVGKQLDHLPRRLWSNRITGTGCEVGEIA